MPHIIMPERPVQMSAAGEPSGDGWAQDIATRIVNVNWAGGLAVEFGDKEGPKQDS